MTLQPSRTEKIPVNLADAPLSAVLTAKVMTLLARPSTPAEARAAVEERALAGEHITVAEAERLIAEAKAEEHERTQAAIQAEIEAARGAIARAKAEAQAEVKAKQDALDRVGRALTSQEDVIRDLRARITEAEAGLERAKAEGSREAQKTLASELAELNQALTTARAAEYAAIAERDRVQAEVEAIIQARVAERAEEQYQVLLTQRQADLKALQKKVDNANKRVKELTEAAEVEENRTQRLRAEAKKHQDYIAHTQSAEHEAARQLEVIEALLSALADTLLEVEAFDYPPQPRADKLVIKAAEMCRGMALVLEDWPLRTTGRGAPTPLRIVTDPEDAVIIEGQAAVSD